MMDDDALDRLLSGDLEELMGLPKRVVRLFISSTFTDMVNERNSLMERVYPRLKKYCRERYGLDFQVVDMRWGVRDEATDDHQTASLCSREIENCQRMSLGPNFVALLGDKYGFRPLCNKIKSTEFRAIRRCLIELDIGTDILDNWYREDTNAVPAEYLLQPISSILKNFTNRNEPELQSADQSIWFSIQERLHELLLIGSNRLVAQGRMADKERLMKYSISVTEREIIEGCLDMSEARQSCLVYVRSIVDLRQHLARYAPLWREQAPPNKQQNLDGPPITVDDSETVALRRVAKQRRQLIAKYIDLNPKQPSQLDEEAQEALTNLKKIKIETKMAHSKRNLMKYEIGWHEQEGISVQCEEHKSYLAELTEHFYRNTTRMIRRAAQSEQHSKSELTSEVLQHSHYARHLSKSFHGRSKEIEHIRHYILSATSGSGCEHAPASAQRLPLFVYGVSGSGKTSVLARVATLAKDWIQGARSQQQQVQIGGAPSTARLEDRWDHKPCIIMRFSGATPMSSSIVGVLTSVSRQLQYNFYQFGLFSGSTSRCHEQVSGGSQQQQQLSFEPVENDFVHLVFRFRQLLDNCRHPLHRNRLFVIILDSIERLSTPAGTSVHVKYSWLTSLDSLPENVRLIVSCSSQPMSSDFYHLKRHFLLSYFPSRTLLEAAVLLGGARGVGPEVASLPETPPRTSGEQEELLDKSAVCSPSDTLARMKQLLLATAILRKASVSAQLAAAEEAPKPSSKPPMTNTTKSSSVLHQPAAYTSLPPLNNNNNNNNNRTTTQPLPPSSNNNNTLDSHWRPNVWIVHVRPMGVELAQVVLQRWLSDHGRLLSKQQWAIVRKSLLNCSRPIFVKLAFGEIINWKSYSLQNDSSQLTFGSSLLEGLKLNEIDSGELRELISLVEHCACEPTGAAPAGRELHLRMQILAMEQQWLNYLDYERSRDEQEQEKLLASGQPQPELAGSASDKGLARYRASQSGNQSSSSICHLSSTIEAAICQLFARIELKHGHLLTKHSLSYITASRNGICENELEDILSLDDVVLDDVYQYHLPPVRRIPPLLWTRIRNDLSEFLSERDADGIVVNWHHGQFGLVARARYLAERRQLRYIHSTMADYFLGRWADIPKPFKCASRHQALIAVARLAGANQEESSSGAGSRSFARDTQIAAAAGNKPSGAGASLSGFRSTGSSRSRTRSSAASASLRINAGQSKADRRVPQQPLTYITTTASTSGANGNADQEANHSSSERQPKGKRYNLRKLTELPHHLRRAHRFRDLAEHVLFNYKWLFATLDALGLQSLLADFDESTHTLEALLAEVVGPNNNNNAGQPSTEIEKLRSMIGQLRTLNDTLRLSCSVLHSDPQMLAPQLLGRLLSMVQPLPPLHHLSDHQIQQQQHSNSYLVSLLRQCDKDGSLDCALLPAAQCLQAPDGLLLSSLEGHSFSILSMMADMNQRHLLAASDRFIMWNASTGEVSRYVDPQIQGSIILACELSLNNEYAIGYTSDYTILALDMLTQQVSKFRFDLEQPGEPLLGFALINKVAGTSFLVFTSREWFVFQLTKNVSSSSTTNNRVVIDFLYSMKPQREGSYTLVNVEQVSATEHLNMSFVSLQHSAKLTLLSGWVQKNTSGWTFTPWNEEISAQAISLEYPFKQLILADSSGRVTMRRCRKCCWSNSKCIWFPAGKSEESLTKSDEFVDDETCLTPLAIEVELFQGSVNDEMFEVSRFDQLELASFEAQVDTLYGENEEQAGEESQVFRGGSSTEFGGHQLKQYIEPPVKHVKMYRANEIVVLSFGLKEHCGSSRESCLNLPKGSRNTNITANKCHTKSLILDDTFLVVALNKQLLIYSLARSLLMRTVDAHSGRIVKLLPILNSGSASTLRPGDKPLNLASASMDRSVKIWNLSNLSKESHVVDQLDGPVHSVSVSRQGSLVSCLGRSQLSLLDWRTLTMYLRSELVDLIGDSRLVKCRLSHAGAHLCLATNHSVHLFSIEAGSRDAMNKTNWAHKVGLNLKFSFQLMTGSSARSIRFFLKDSRLLIVLEAIECEEEHSSKTAAIISGAPLASRLLIQCRSVPESKLVYSINTSSPVLWQNIPTTSRQRQHHTSNHGRPNVAGSQQGMARRLSLAPRIQEGTPEQTGGPLRRLPVLTLDEQFVVCVEAAPQQQQQQQQQAPSSMAILQTDIGGAGSGVMRKRVSNSSSGGGQTREERKTGCWLVVYSARDGARLRELDLSRLEVAPVGAGGGRPTENNNGKGALNNRLPAQRLQVVDATQFSHLKPVAYGGRGSVVALMDKESGVSHFVDTQAGQLLLGVRGWTGKLSSDGKLGLGRPLKSLPASNLRPEVGGTTLGPAPTRLAGVSQGLELLDMLAGSATPVKSLLSQEQLASVSSIQHESAAGAGQLGTGSDSGADVRCGFAGQGEEYVYYYDLGLRTLLLLRVSDAQLVANYRLPIPVTKICSIRDGYALLLAFSDGSLTTLAIVDSQRPESVARLAEYPSRRSLEGAA